MRRLLFCMALLAPLAHAQTATLAGDPAHPAMASHWLETRLYFGLSLADAPANPAIEARWQTFLDHEVTRRFPAGLTVMDAYGQWLPQTAQSDPNASPKRLRSKVLIILHPGSAETPRRSMKSAQHGRSLPVSSPSSR